MGYKIDENDSLINTEQKIRISLSKRAMLTMAEDMEVFSVNKTSTFINTVFENYKTFAKSSISLYLQQRKLELELLFADTKLNNNSKNIAIKELLDVEEAEIKEFTTQLRSNKATSKIFHINNSNKSYLEDVCDEEQYYKKPGQYIRCVIEEYCSLPFIKREQIFRKQIYDIVEQACKEKRILKIVANHYGKDQLFYVYPYKIVPDSFHTQSYLVCYSRKSDEDEKDKIVASFSMARMKMPTMLTKTFYLNKQEVSFIEDSITNYSPAYLVGKNEHIHVRLTDKGKLTYRSKLFSRPEKIESLSSEDVYVFDCTQQQIFNYFFSFGPDAEIISPEYLRNRFKRVYKNALDIY